MLLLQKIDELNNSNKTDIEKELLIEQYNKYYKQGKYLYMRDNLLTNKNSFDNIVNNISKNNFSSNQNSIKSSYSSLLYKLNQDGSKSIIKTRTKLKNDNEIKTIISYKKMPNGEIISLEPDEIT